MVDVCLVVEGTYPRVVGGVSQWVDSLVRGLPELSFGVVRLDYDGEHGSTPDAYEAPPNLGEIVSVALDPESPLDVAAAVTRAPQATAYHAVSTGFAGLAASRMASTRRAPLILSEHGLYWREARLGIATGSHKGHNPGPPPGRTHLRGEIRGALGRSERRAPHLGARQAARRGEILRWVRVQERLARRAYAQADAIVSVCAANSRLQRVLGARAERLHVIHNGVDVPQTSSRDRVADAPLIGMVARVSPVKDVVTYLRACRLIADELPGARFVIVGPVEEEPGYTARCQQLIADLGLDEHVRFTGQTDPSAWYRRLDVAVLTSISEGEPFALLEAMAAGVPVVATNVGGCAELLGAGSTQPAGMLTAPQDPRATAAAVMAIWRDRHLRATLVDNARRRIGERHTEHGMLERYRGLYDRVAACA